MSEPTTVLSIELLEAYEERLRSTGAPLDEWVRPGLDAEKIDEAVSALGLSLPSEGRIWWEWHDGPTDAGREGLLGPRKEGLTLERAVELYRQFRMVAEKSAGAWPQNDPDFLWNPTWFPIAGRELPVVIDCGVAEDRPTTVRFIDWQNIDEFFEPQASSLGEMVSWWIEAIDVGAWEWLPAEGRWLEHSDRLERKQRINPLL